MKNPNSPVIESIVINARRWFQKAYGNTYFSGELLVNDQQVAVISLQYGYGEQCVYELIQLAIKNGALPAQTENNAVWRYLDSLCDRDQQSINIVDVKRKKDL